MKVADFICIGAQRAGTTWLFENIRHHPGVSMRTKELDYFISDRNAEWYSRQFTGSDGRLCGDISPNYGAKVGLAKRIHELCPNAQIVYLLREPAARAFSQWKMARGLGVIPKTVTFRQAFTDDLRRIRTKGEYYSFVREYTPLYPLNSRFKVFWHDDIAKRPNSMFREFQIFIGADPERIAPALGRIVNAPADGQSMSEDDYKNARNYYAGSDRELRRVLNLSSLPWD